MKEKTISDIHDVTPTNSNDPLSQLFADKEDEGIAVKELLVDMLLQYVKIQRSGELIFLPEFYNLGREDKILAFLAATKARSLLMASDKFPDGARPKDIIEKKVLPVGSVKSAIKSLLEKKHLIVKDIGGRYIVPMFALAKIKGRLINS